MPLQSPKEIKKTLVSAVTSGKRYRSMHQTTEPGSGLQTEAACRAEDVVSGQVASADQPQASERLPPMQDTPVVDENHLTKKREDMILRSY